MRRPKRPQFMHERAWQPCRPAVARHQFDRSCTPDPWNVLSQRSRQAAVPDWNVASPGYGRSLVLGRCANGLETDARLWRERIRGSSEYLRLVGRKTFDQMAGELKA